MNRHKLQVKKRDGSLVPVRFDEITDRITELCETEPKLDYSINPFDITKTILDRLKNGITTSEIDDFAAELCAHKLDHPDYFKLAARLVVSNHQKNLETSTGLLFSEVCTALYNNKDQNGMPSPIVNEKIYNIVQKYKHIIDNIIVYERDFYFDYLSFKTLHASYLQKIYKENSKQHIVECPQHMFLRTALSIECSRITIEDINNENIPEDFFDNVVNTYDLMSNKYYTHATPTLYNAGIKREQLFSCFILNMGDSVKEIFKCYGDVAEISKWAGGIGISGSDVRGRNSYVRGTGGKSDGLKPMLEVLNSVSKYINQGSRRNGSFAVYLEPWHVDIIDYLLGKNPHKGYAKDLFYGLWIPDLFMECVKNDDYWYLMCPSQCPNLTTTYDEPGELAFTNLYKKYVSEGRYSKKIKASEIWNAIINSQIETGMPYMCYKDHVNRKSNHKNIGVVKASNLCTEIMEYHSTEKYACCCLASIVLPTYVEYDENQNPFFNYDKLVTVTKTITRNLDLMIDYNYYPVPETEKSNKSERPIGIGVQGFADVLFKMKLPFDSNEARDINKKIFESIYFGAITKSCELAKEKGTYSSYENSPISKGLFQFDLWSQYSENQKEELMYKDEWETLRSLIKQYGVRNSLLTAVMPTASTSSIMGSNECIEPISSNFFTKRVIAGEYIILNKYLMEELVKKGLWSMKLKNKIIENRGSIQNIPEIPQDIKDIYKICWEIKNKTLIDLSIERAPFVDQSQSLNLFFEVPDFSKITNAHFYGHSKGLKTGMYYLRQKPTGYSEPITSTTFEKEAGKTQFYEKLTGSTGSKESTETKVEQKTEQEEECVMCSG